MNIFKFKRSIKKVSLTEDEKAATRGHLLAVMNNHPVRKTDQSRHLLRKTYRGNLFITKNYMYTKVIIALIILLGTGGTVAAAENSLPGSPLYPVKVHLNENLRSAVAVTAEQQARWDAQVIKRRIKEAAQLSAHGNLTAEMESDLATNIQEHAKSIDKNLVKLEEGGKLQERNEIAADLKGVVNAYHGTIGSTTVNTEASLGANIQQTLFPILEIKTNGRAQNQAQMRTDVQNESNIGINLQENLQLENDSEVNTQTHPEVEIMTVAVENEINSLTEIRNKLKNKSAEISAEVKAEIQGSIEASEEVLSEAQDALKSKFDSVLSALVNQLLLLRAEVKGLVEIENSLDLNVNAHQNSLNGSGENTQSNNESQSEIELKNNLKGKLNI